MILKLQVQVHQMKLKTKCILLMVAIQAIISASVWLFSQYYIARIGEQWAVGTPSPQNSQLQSILPNFLEINFI